MSSINSLDYGVYAFKEEDDFVLGLNQFQLWLG